MTFGNAWGHDGIPFNGKDMRQLAQSLGYGVTYAVMAQGDLAVTAQLTPANTVRVAAGRGLVNATGAGLTGQYHVWNDGSVTSPTFTATGADPRTDRVIIRVVAGVPAVQIVAGTPGPGTPPPPTVTGDNFMVLARVQIPASTSTVTNAMIVDERIVVGQPPSRVVSAALPFLNPSAGDLNYEPDTGRYRAWAGGAWGVSWPLGRIYSQAGSTASGALTATGTIRRVTDTQGTITNTDGVTRRYEARVTVQFNLASGTFGLYRPIVSDGAGASLPNATTEQVATAETGGPGQVAASAWASFTLAPGASQIVCAAGLRVAHGTAADALVSGTLTVFDLGPT